MTTAICSAPSAPPAGVRAALALPYADPDMMQLHVDEISRDVAEGAHAVLLLDQAGWHTTGKFDVPDNITPIFLPSPLQSRTPSRISGNISARTSSQTLFEDCDAIIDAARRRLIAQPESIGMCDWAHLGQPL